MESFSDENSNNFALQIWRQKHIRPNSCAISRSKMKERKKKKKARPPCKDDFKMRVQRRILKKRNFSKLPASSQLFIILFLLVLFDLLMPFDQSYARKNIWWFIIVGILRQLSESGARFTDRSNHCCVFSINVLVPFFKLIMISLSHLECRR